MPRSKEITLVANLIVKNHGRYLTALIPALQRMCDRIVVKDTGSTEEQIQSLTIRLRPEDVFLAFKPGESTDQSALRNQLLEHIEQGQWGVYFEPNELPSMAMYHLKDYLRRHADPGRYLVTVYHMVSDHNGGYVHEQRVFFKTHNTKWIFKELLTGAERLYTIPVSIGMAILNFEKYKGKKSATPSPVLPYNVDYDAPPGWLERILHET